jgi:acetylornithine/N-succinyldiaminopimelate aminotransferase
MSDKIQLSNMLGASGGSISKAMASALNFLNSSSKEKLLSLVGKNIESIPSIDPVDKSALQDSYGGKQSEPCDDLLVGKGMFYITEQGNLCLDCTSGHYQMLWGYNDPDLVKAVNQAVESGIVWDNHCNIPQMPVKQLAHRLVELANGSAEKDRLDTVHLGCCTGSVACAAALKIQLVCYERTKKGEGTPVIIVLDGNYHGTDMVAQYLRGMWKNYVRNLKVIALQPNDERALQKAFKQYGKRVAGFWAEPVMMNREAIVVEPSYLQLARKLCDENGALMAIDEIQTGFWQPEVFMYRTMGFTPDLVIAGKGMAAGFHPQAAVIYKSRYDVLEQYDAISTNGSAPLPCYVSLCCLDKIQKHSNLIIEAGDRYHAGMQSLAAEFPEILKYATGKRHMTGLKFHDVKKAIDFHKRAVKSGLWVRVHAYHEGHSTVLSKLPLIADEQIVNFIIERFRYLLKETK